MTDNPVPFDLAGVDEKSVSIALISLCRRTIELGKIEGRVHALTKELATAAKVLIETE